MAIYDNFESDEEMSMILIMGVTGSGKSYFINKLSNGAVIEGHSLKSSKLSNFSSG
jgi:predicted GTPase